MMKLKSALIAISMFMVVGAFLSKSAHAECKEGEGRVTTTGAVFICDTSQPSLGEAWRDPDGLIWGDLVVTNDDAQVRFMVQSFEYFEHYMREIGRPLPPEILGAEEYCKSIGARLPSKEEFTRLREYMGAQSGTHEGYSAQVLPNLLGLWFWSSSVDPVRGADFAFVFGSSGGKFGSVLRINSDTYTVRCVVGR